MMKKSLSALCSDEQLFFSFLLWFKASLYFLFTFQLVDLLLRVSAKP